MTKSEAREVAKLTAYAHEFKGASKDSDDVAMLARSFSALVRSSRASRNELMTVAMGWPVIVQHSEFIV